MLHELRRSGYHPTTARVETEQDYRDQLRSTPEIILSDFTMPEFDAFRALEIMQERQLDIPFIIVSGTIGEERAVQIMRRGANDYVTKDRLGRLGQAVAQALEKKLMRTEATQAERRLNAQFATTKVLAESLNLEAAVPRIIEGICRSMDWTWSGVWMVDPEGKSLELIQYWHCPAARLESFLTDCHMKTFVHGEGLPGRVWATGEPLWVPDVMKNEHFFGKPAAQRAGLHAAFVFPILIRTEVVGVIEFLSQFVEERNEKLWGMMTAICTQIGQFIDRRRVEEGLRLFRALIDKTTDGIEVVDPETGRFLDVNEKACVSHGYTREEYLKLSLTDIVPEVAAGPWRQLMEKHRLAGSHTIEGQHRRKDGSVFPVEVSLTYIHLDRDYLVAVVRDITDRKQLEEQFRQSQKMDAIGSLAAGIAHDFNNVLTIINGYSEIVQMQLPAGHPMRELVGEISHAGQRAASLTRQLLAFSRKQLLDPKVLDLNSVVTDTVKMLQRLIGEDIDLNTVLESGLGRVKADLGQIEQILINLVVNARDAMPQGGKLKIETANVELDESYTRSRVDLLPGAYVLLAVTDNGSGMDTATKARVFEPFFTTKEPGKGTGLGLATVFGIVRQSGGDIAVYSEPGRGTTFKIYLPAVVRIVPTATSPSEVKTPIQGTETILLAEDEPALRALTHDARLHGFGSKPGREGAPNRRRIQGYDSPARH